MKQDNIAEKNVGLAKLTQPTWLSGLVELLTQSKKALGVILHVCVYVLIH